MYKLTHSKWQVLSHNIHALNEFIIQSINLLCITLYCPGILLSWTLLATLNYREQYQFCLNLECQWVLDCGRVSWSIASTTFFSGLLTNSRLF